MKPCRGPLSPANYVETAKTIKHLVVFIPHFNFSQYCDRGKYCAFPRVVAVKESKSKVRGEQIDEFITFFLFIPSPLCLWKSSFRVVFWDHYSYCTWLESPPLLRKNTTQTARPSTHLPVTCQGLFPGEHTE